ncbi:MAG: fibro-slime domain-containing protein [Fibromonadaceae bacterium]|jgi:fibro-slime domain-containing protein|nr:fibro-slime domain-containing protein [Fibromonadaceae bacterium]
MKNSVCLKRMLAILVFGCQALFAQQVTFYFLPPDNDRWIAGSSYIYDGQNTVLMNVHTRCGWFKKTYASRDAVPENIMIYLGSKGIDKFDMHGTGADPTNPESEWIPLKTSFGTTATSLYFYQDPNSDEGFVFRTAEPPNTLGEEAAGRCSYKMAAFIYDTDNSVNKSFSGTYTAPSTANNGIRRGIVAPTLDPVTKKPTFVAANGYANWISEASFNAAFTPKGVLDGKISNIPRCYDMPFDRATNGSWEFDSDRMRTPANPAAGADNGRNLVGGFYPYNLEKAYGIDPDGTTADYTDCPDCNKEYSANCFQIMDATKLNNLAPVTWRDTTYTGVAAFDRTRFADGTNHSTYFTNASGAATYGCDSPNSSRGRPGFTGVKKDNANLSFCFESHAEFTYEKGQEFLFRGDDDIWIFINNQLVIDLGGIHMPAPGYVDLDTIKTPVPLEAGSTYPIDIFFCERMGTQSNVRVSTNMYITQKSTFFSDPARTDNAMCAGLASGNDCASKMSGTGSSKREEFCGEGLLNNSYGNYNVDFYMVNRSTNDTLYLSQPPTGSRSQRATCQGTGNTFTCLAKDGVGAGSGITIDKAVYSCGGRYKCDGNQISQDKVDIPSGSWVVYARLTENGKPTANKPIQIDKFRGPTNARIIWGKLVNAGDALLDAYGDTTKSEQSVIAGKLSPIYVAIGSWEEKHKTFDERELDPTDDIRYSLSISGVSLDDIDIYSVSHEDTTLASFPRKIPQSGIDTVWVKGSYEMGEQTLEINLSGANPASDETPSMKLSIYQPRLRFTRADDGFDFVNPRNFGSASGYTIWDELPPFVGESLPVYVTAHDTASRKTPPRFAFCSHCSFPISQKSYVNTEGNSEGIVKGEPLRIENGRQTIYIKGQEVVEGKDYAQWHIIGPSKEYTFAKWDSLQFRDAPIPMPLFSKLYDRNGDGFGDSLEIKFGKPFMIDDKIADSLLPILIEVTWEQGYTVAFHHPDYTIDNLKNGNYVRDNLYNDAFFKKNRTYWEKYLNLKKNDSLIVISDSITVFSKNIATAGYNSGSGKVASYTPFYNQNQCIPGRPCPPAAFMWRDEGYDAEVLDRVPPIVVRATYSVENNKKCGTSKDNACRESVVVTLSEPIFAAPGADKNNFFATKNPFSYCFEYSQQPKSKCSEGKGIAESDRRSLKWDNLNWKTWELPQDKTNSEDVSTSAFYTPNNKPEPKEYYEGAIKGDNSVELIYYAYKINEDETTRMPKADDWVKIRPPSSKGGLDVFYDAAGNSANPRERGVLITGKNRYEQDKVVIAGIGKETTPEDPPFGGVFTDLKKLCQIPGHNRRENCAAWMSDEAKRWANDYLYDTTKGNVTEFLPVPKGTNAKEAGGNYPSSVGAVFSGIKKDEVEEFLAYCSDPEYPERDCRDEFGNKIDKGNIAKAISLNASVYYHTNLGNYTAHRNPVVANCTDKVFQSSQVGNSAYLYGDNCLGNEYSFYLAWDLKTNKNRFVGTGAYVAVTKFFWQIKYSEGKNGSLKSKKFDQHEFVELYGVYRTK